MKRVNILWTGGWDSTYRVLTLMSKPVSIQPYYIKDSNRKSQEFELKAINTITADIRNHPSTRCELLDLIIVNRADVPRDEGISNAYSNILKTNFYGAQYDWLGRFAKTIKNLEINMHKDDTANFFKKYGELTRKDDPLTGDYYVLDPERSANDVLKVFGNFHYPILYTSKLEMKEWAINTGLIEIMNKSWFCYRPINNEPCGRCHPCNYTINEGMGYRFSKSAIRRHKLNKFTKLIKPSVYIKRAKKSLYKLWLN